jgi:hypothetical protein
MPVHWCPKCSTPYTEVEVGQGVCPVCQVPVEPPLAARRDVPTPAPTADPASRRVGPFLLGLSAGCLIGAASVWSVLRLSTPTPGVEDGPMAVIEELRVRKAEAEDKARRSEAARVEAVKALEAATGNARKAEAARADMEKALDAAKEQAADAERKQRDALARLAEERAKGTLGQPGAGEKKPTWSFVRDWQLLGPFASRGDRGHDTVFAPEGVPVSLQKTYAGVGGLVKWRPYHSLEDKIDLAVFFKYREAGAAYAVCWAFSDADRDVALAVGSDDGIRLWVNGEKIHDIRGGRQARPGQDIVKARLKKGWNEIRAKVDNIVGTWELYVEFRTADGRRPLETVTSTSPPPPAR